MNRRIRIRTYGGVGGGVPQGPLLPDPDGRRAAVAAVARKDQAQKNTSLTAAEQKSIVAALPLG